MHPRSQMTRPSRKGLVTIVALTCLLIVVSLMGSMLRSSLRSRRECKTRLQVAQTQWLLEAGIRRAVAGFAADGDYKGESWKPGQQLGSFHTPSVDIAVVTREGQSQWFEVTASLADLPESVDATPFVVRRSHQWKIAKPSNPSSDNS